MEEFGIIPKKAGWVSWDDDFVDELRRTVKACKLFLFFPIFLMADGWELDNQQHGRQYDLEGSTQRIAQFVASLLPLYSALAPRTCIDCRLDLHDRFLLPTTFCECRECERMLQMRKVRDVEYIRYDSWSSSV